MREKRGRTIAQLLRSVGRVVIVTIAVLLTFNVFINIAPILAGAGILGLAVSFGAQSLVRDIISGFFILLENQFAVGDVIEAAGKSGVVERMTLRVVVLRDLEGTMHVIPNGEMKVVSNKTRGWSRAVVDIVGPLHRRRGPRARRGPGRGGAVLHRPALGPAARRAGRGARRRVDDATTRWSSEPCSRPSRARSGAWPASSAAG